MHPDQKHAIIALFHNEMFFEHVDFPPPENKIVLEGAKLVSFSSAGV